MFVSDDLVFLHLQKAAGTFVVDRLMQRLPGTGGGGHDPLYEGKQGRVVAAAVRNPWDWYVSLWSYGCMGQGEVRGRLTASRRLLLDRTLRAALSGRASPAETLAQLQREQRRDPAAWRDMYASAEDPARFRRWLRAVLTLPGCQHLPGGYPSLPMRGQVGFMSYRVLRLFTDWGAWQASAAAICNSDDALDFYRRHCIVDHVLRTEQVETDLDRLLATLGVPAPADAPPPSRRNRSKRSPHAEYYNAETVALVAEKDRLVVKAFGYAPPGMAA